MYWRFAATCCVLAIAYINVNINFKIAPGQFENKKCLRWNLIQNEIQLNCKKIVLVKKWLVRACWLRRIVIVRSLRAAAIRNWMRGCRLRRRKHEIVGPVPGRFVSTDVPKIGRLSLGAAYIAVHRDFSPWCGLSNTRWWGRLIVALLGQRRRYRTNYCFTKELKLEKRIMY